jgi:hypothetical protein
MKPIEYHDTQKRDTMRRKDEFDHPKLVTSGNLGSFTCWIKAHTKKEEATKSILISPDASEMSHSAPARPFSNPNGEIYS